MDAAGPHSPTLNRQREVIMLKLSSQERWLLAGVVVLLMLVLFGPHVASPPHAHDFADQRAWGVVPCALDVLSNVPFALWGLAGWGLLLFRRGAASSHIQIDGSSLGLALLFFTGLFLTAAASAWYHWHLTDAGLAIDRLGMVVAFAGVVGLAADDRVSGRAGIALALVTLGLGTASVLAWLASGNLLAWAVIQFGGMALVLALAVLRPRPGSLGVRWVQLIAIYAVAKLLEVADHAVFELTAQAVSGHSLKHVVASCAAWPVIVALARTDSDGLASGEMQQNPAQLGASGR
jgi:hypothetical protein